MTMRYLLFVLVLCASCAPITSGWKASDFRGAYWCDCEKAPGDDTPECYCRTLAPGVDYRKCSAPEQPKEEP